MHVLAADSNIVINPCAGRKSAFVGVIHAQNKFRGAFTRENIELLQSMASQLGETLNNNVMYAFRPSMIHLFFCILTHGVTRFVADTTA